MRQYVRKILPVFSITMFVCAALFFIFYIADGARLASRNVVQTIVSPGQSVVANAFENVSDFFENIRDNQALREELEATKQQLAECQDTLREYQHYADRNEELSKLLNITEEYSDYEYVHATVIAKSSGVFFYQFTINKGSMDGIAVNDTVINGDGLIGRISEVSLNSATVTTLLDEDTFVSSVMTASRDMVMVYGNYQVKTEGKLMMEYIPSSTDIKVGDVVETSGIGGIYPGGLIIGTIHAFAQEGSSIEQYALVKPVVDFSKLETVMILKTAEREAEQ